MPGRPGTGGRQPFAAPYTPTAATQQLIDELGAATPGPSGAFTWQVSEEGTGVIFARLSTRETQQGETALGQVHPARALAAQLDLSVRFIVVTTMNSGGLDYDERPDFAAMESGFAQGWLKWVMWRDAYRLARDPLAAELFYRFLRQNKIDLYLTELGRRIEWERDRLLLRVTGAMSAEEREQTKARTHGALKSRWLEEGRGYPGARKFGFRRNPYTKFLEVDPEQWEFVKRIHYGYAALGVESPRSTKHLEKELGALGCTLSDTQIYRILRDEAYVTGEWSVDYDGTTYPMRPVPLQDAVPSEVFQRNQERLDLRRGRPRRAPSGTYLLNRIEVTHQRCEAVLNSAGLRPVLRSGSQGKRPALVYRHRPWAPDACRGWVVDRVDLERSIVEAVSGCLVSNELVLRAWADTDRSASSLASALVSPESASQLRKRIAALRRQLGRLERSFLDRVAAGDDVDERDYRDLVGAIRAEAHELRSRLSDTEADVGCLQRPARTLEPERAALEDALATVLTPTLPHDETLVAARAAAVRAVVDAIRLRDVEGGVIVELASPLAPAKQ